MRKFLALVCGSMMVFLLFFTPGNVVQAEEDCGCPGTVITGVERNKLVADLLKYGEFKMVKMELENQGFSWQGADAIEIRNLNGIYPDFPSLIGFQAVFVDEFGALEGAGFFLIDGSLSYVGHFPIEADSH